MIVGTVRSTPSEIVIYSPGCGVFTGPRKASAEAGVEHYFSVLEPNASFQKPTWPNYQCTSWSCVFTRYTTLASPGRHALPSLAIDPVDATFVRYTSVGGAMYPCDLFSLKLDTDTKIILLVRPHTAICALLDEGLTPPAARPPQEYPTNKANAGHSWRSS